MTRDIVGRALPHVAVTDAVTVYMFRITQPHVEQTTGQKLPSRRLAPAEI